MDLVVAVAGGTELFLCQQVFEEERASLSNQAFRNVLGKVAFNTAVASQRDSLWLWNPSVWTLHVLTKAVWVLSRFSDQHRPVQVITSECETVHSVNLGMFSVAL